jgi:hydroxymethylpyrimidine pyrophosphatase-like HAD family hydrolase
MKQLNECIITEQGHLIYREEEGKEISFVNIDYELVCDIVPIEKCVLTKAEDGRRCDFLFLFNKEKQEYQILKNIGNLAYYVELKGIDLEDACEQLHNSIDKTRSQIDGFEIFPLVVSSREYVPKYDNNEWNRNLKRLLRKEIQFEVTPFTVNV